MEDIVNRYLEDSIKLNDKIMSTSRFLLLVILFYSVDGLQFREIKSALNVSDGWLSSNLKPLINMKYVHEIKTTIDDEKVTIYILTNLGKRELFKFFEWMKQGLKVVEDKCMPT